jgi:hypothetical protein
VHYIKYEGPWEDVAIDRHNVVSSHRIDTDDLTVAYFNECGDDCLYDVADHSVLRKGETVITEAEFEAECDAINRSNSKIAAADPPAPAPDLAEAEFTAEDRKALRALLP